MKKEDYLRSNIESNLMNFRTKVPYFITFGVHFSLSIWELNGSLFIFVNFLNCSVAEHAFLSAIGVQILDGLIGEGNLLSTIWVMFFDLFAEFKRKKNESPLLHFSF